MDTSTLKQTAIFISMVRIFLYEKHLNFYAVGKLERRREKRIKYHSSLDLTDLKKFQWDFSKFMMVTSKIYSCVYFAKYNV